MIEVANTIELEKYGLDKIRDDEQVRVLGGLKGKVKYSPERYKVRTTYTGRQIKQIINEMRKIERTIPNEWNEWQRAKYIYEVLGKNISYRQIEDSQRDSNLSVLVNREGVCAGYSLLYKEMMDRQGIKCDYIRGRVPEVPGGLHAWNVLTIDGVTFPIDLTWESNRMRKGFNELEYFGVNPNFELRHRADDDERKYQYSVLDKEFVRSISYNKRREEIKLSEEEKISVLKNAIEETYKKFVQNYGEDLAKRQVEIAIKKYIQENNSTFFTRTGDARQNIEKFVSRNDMLKLISRMYIKGNKQENNRMNMSILDNSINETIQKYGEGQGILALEKFIRSGETTSFTRENNARRNIMEYVSRENAMEIVIQDAVEKEIQLINKVDHTYNQIQAQGSEYYFNPMEFEQIKLPEEKRKTVISKVYNWIKEKFKFNNNIKENSINKDNYKENNNDRSNLR